MILDNYSDYSGVKHLHFCPQLTQELSGYCKTRVINRADTPFCSVSVPHDQQCPGLSCGAGAVSALRSRDSRCHSARAGPRRWALLDATLRCQEPSQG